MTGNNGMFGLAMETPILFVKKLTQSLDEVYLTTRIYHQSKSERYLTTLLLVFPHKIRVSKGSTTFRRKYNQQPLFRILSSSFIQMEIFSIDDVLDQSGIYARLVSKTCLWKRWSRRSADAEEWRSETFLVRILMTRHGVCVATWTNKPPQNDHERDFVF